MRPRTIARHVAAVALARRYLVVFLVAALVTVAAGRLAVPPAAPPANARPSVAALDAAVALAETYADGLYKPLGGGEAVQSEDYGIPVRVYFPRYRVWRLLGEGRAGDCLAGSCTGPTSISAGPSGPSAESMFVRFDSPTTKDAVQLAVSIDWRAGVQQFRVRAQGSNRDVASAADVYLGRRRLVTLPAGGAPAAGGWAAPTSDRQLLQSLRYTVRHATQEAFLYWRARGDQTRADALAKFLRANGFAPGLDMRAAIFGTSRGLPDDLPYVDSGPQDMYRDCRHLPRANDAAYPYESKVCLLGVPTFVAAAKFDPFAEAAEALAVLRNHGPDYAYMTGGAGVIRPAVTSPRRVARQLELLFGKVGNGEPSCTPTGCDTSRASALRTFHFGVLEAVLGYRYGDSTSGRFADAVAAAALRAQVGTDGLVRRPDDVAYRPAQVGAFPIYWDRQGRFVPTGGAVQATTDRLSMPREYAGQVPSDTETTLDGWAFLTTYRCLARGTGCGLSAWSR